MSQQPHSKLQIIKNIEASCHKKWDSLKIFEMNASDHSEKEKYFITFPYPYMNGILHLGHGFSLSKAEFAAGYQRMKGKRVLWPFAFHGTGMPIAACAQKLSEEITRYGNPPTFPQEDKEAEILTESTRNDMKFKGKKAKKNSGSKKQWEILQEMGCHDIDKFTDPKHWLDVFPTEALKDLKLFGSRIDYRRSFMTTDANPYYDSFIKWQFKLLQEKNKILYGKRYTIFSPKDNQPCQDHDRAIGEGVVPQEYTLIKLRIVDLSSLEKIIPEKYRELTGKVFLAAATLRPETMYGQTNCWISPFIEYGGYVVNEEIFIMTQRSASNFSYQRKGVSDRIFSINGESLIGIKVTAPLSFYKEVFILPLETIKDSIGTGIVTSVPSDSPEDFIALRTLESKEAYREKLGIRDKWVLPFKPVPHIEIPNSLFGRNIAEEVCKSYGISSIKESDKLQNAKKEAYKEGFYHGIIVEGPFKGISASEAKSIARETMFTQGLAVPYSEPDGKVISRSGDECVVALTNQWYLSYGEQNWKEKVIEHITDNMHFFNEQVRNGILESTEWLKEWACSRSFGLGTKLPFGEDSLSVIDSLSDSTIYMAYYTVCHILQSEGDLNGQILTGKLGIKPGQMTEHVWNYVFIGSSFAEACTTVPQEALKEMRKEFLYWYPVDLRVSGKDLIQNHLVMSLYNHIAVWESESTKWPQSFFCNGHILIDKEKMSKSKGNFKTLRDAIQEYSTDATRIALADAGDTLDDPNFVTANIPSIVTKLSSLIEFCETVFAQRNQLRTDKLTTFDEIFVNDINSTIDNAEKFYDRMQYRAALHCVFYDFVNLRDNWKQLCGSLGMHHDVALSYIATQAKLLCPIAPHVAEHIYQNFTMNPINSIQSIDGMWPESKAVDKKLTLMRVLLHDTLNEIRSQIRKSKQKKKDYDAVIIYCCSSYTSWQCEALDILRKYVFHGNKEHRLALPLPKDLIGILKNDVRTKNKIEESLGFLSFLVENELIDEIQGSSPLLNDHTSLVHFERNIMELSGLEYVTVISCDEALKTDPKHSLANRARLSKPSVELYKHK